jgi:ATP-dependent exoDNAse (exonuclease V) beta subunit
MKPVDHKEREAAATDLDTTFFVEAAAGTGKTTALVARIVSAVDSGRARLSEIVAITFTEKAAGELKVRLREKLEEKLQGDKRSNALADLERAHITTIHSFCAWVLRERPIEAVVDPLFAVADELQRRLLFEEAWDEWLEAELGKNPPALRQALMFGVELDALSEMAALLVEHRDRLSDVKWPASEPLDVGAVVSQLKAVAPTLERCLKHFTARDENPYKLTRTLLDSLPSLSHATVERKIAVLRSLEMKQPKAKAHFDSEEAFREMRDTVKELASLLEGFAAAADHNFLVELVVWLRGFVAHFQKAKHDRALLDFDDLLMKTRDLMRGNAEVRRELQQRFKFVLIDEFQDTDPVQTEVALLLGEGTPGKLFVVGDPKQSIYGFRRADIEMYADTRRDIEQKGRVLTFRQNFRSASTILDWVNDVFTKILVKSTDGDYQPEYIALASWPGLQTATAAVTLLRPKQLLKASAGELRHTEATAVARYLRQQVDSGACEWGDVALLFRSFTGVETYGDVLQEHGVPFRIIGGRGYYQRQEIQTLSSLLSCLDNPTDKLNLVATLRSPLFGWADELVFLVSATQGLNYLDEMAADATEQMKRTFSLLRELHLCRHDSSVAGYIEHVFARTRICEAFFACQPDGTQSVANLLKALELARQLETAGVRSLRAFVRRLRDTVLGGVEEEPSPASEETKSVCLMTMHKAKGLEFPVVVLPDLAGRSSDSGAKLLFRRDGSCELRFASRRTAGFDEADADCEKREEAEEIRLLYVATTRAKKRLVIPWFAEKGGRIDLLARGFVPAASALVEVPDLELLTVKKAETEKTEAKRGSAAQLIDKRHAWEASRVELLARAAGSMLRKSPSKLSAESGPSEEEPIDTTRARAMDFGVAVHDALEVVNLQATEAEQRMQIEQFLELGGLSDEDKRRAAEMVSNAIGSELLTRVRNAEQVYRELPFTQVLGNGLMEGKIDLLFREKDQWVLVDYKTDARVEIEKYAEQLRAYEVALKQVAGIDLAQKLLFFLASGTIEPVT